MKKYIKLLLLLLVVCCIGGCAKEEIIEEAEDTVTLDWYINFSWYTTPWGQNLVSKAISDITNVEVQFIVPTGTEARKLDAMIASDTLPDLITLGWWEPQVQEMINNDMVYALNELAKEYDPYFFQVADQEVIDWYTSEDGNLYQYPNSATTYTDFMEGKVEGGNLNFLVRKDIYEAIGEPDMTTKEGFVDAVIRATKLFPEVDGMPLIPIGADTFTKDGSNSFDKYLQHFLAVPFEVDGQYYDRYLDEEYISWLKVFRNLNEEGYLSKEIFVDNRAQLEEKMEDGRYFCLLYQGTDIETPQKILKEKYPERIYIAVEGPRNENGDDPVLPVTNIYGWTVTLISKNCKDPERAISFLSYLMSEEGQKITYLGIENETYEVKNGIYSLKPEVKELLESDRVVYDEIYGADNAYWMLQNNIMQNQWINQSSEEIASLKEWTRPYAAYTAQYDIVFEADSEWGNIQEKINEVWGETLPLLLLSKTEEEFDACLNAYKERKYELGYKELQVELTKHMNEAKKKLGMVE